MLVSLDYLCERGLGRFDAHDNGSSYLLSLPYITYPKLSLLTLRNY